MEFPHQISVCTSQARVSPAAADARRFLHVRARDEDHSCKQSEERKGPKEGWPNIMAPGFIDDAFVAEARNGLPSWRSARRVMPLDVPKKTVAGDWFAGPITPIRVSAAFHL